MKTTMAAMRSHVIKCYRVVCDNCDEDEVAATDNATQAAEAFLRLGWEEQNKMYTPTWCPECCERKRIESLRNITSFPGEVIKEIGG